MTSPGERPPTQGASAPPHASHAVSERTLQWCARALSQDGTPGTARVIARLRGGLDAATSLIAWSDGATEREAVLRELPGDLTTFRPQVRREAGILQALPGSPLYPRLIAVDDGEHCAFPSILMTRVPGRSDVGLNQGPPRIEALAWGLADYHAHALVAPACCPALSADPLQADGAAELPHRWSSVAAALDGFEINGDRMTHGDFHIGNALFTQDQLSGIVDWGEAAAGPLSFDVGYCRMDLAIVYGLEASGLSPGFARPRRQRLGSGGRHPRLSERGALATQLARSRPHGADPWNDHRAPGRVHRGRPGRDVVPGTRLRLHSPEAS